MNIEIQVFGRLQRFFGVASFFVSVAETQTLHDVLNSLAEQQPEAAETLARSTWATGQSLLPRQTCLADLQDGMTLVLLPAVSGG